MTLSQNYFPFLPDCITRLHFTVLLDVKHVFLKGIGFAVEGKLIWRCGSEVVSLWGSPWVCMPRTGTVPLQVSSWRRLLEGCKEVVKGRGFVKGPILELLKVGAAQT